MQATRLQEINYHPLEVPYGYIEDNQLFRQSFAEHPALLLKAIEEEDPQALIAQFETAYAKLEKKLTTILAKIDDSQNKASFLSGLQDIKSSIATHQGLGDYEALLTKIGQYENLLDDYVSQNRQKNTDIKKALLLELEAAAVNNDMIEAYNQIIDIKGRWIKTGSPQPEVKKEYEERYQLLMDQFFTKRKAFQDARQELSKARVDEYEQIISEIESILKSGNLAKSQQRIKDLQKDWKEKGRVPEDIFKGLNDRYWKACQSYYDQLKVQRKSDRKSKAQNESDSIKTREEILKNLEDILIDPLTDVEADHQALRKQWKDAGPVSKAKFGPLQTQFIQLSDQLREQHFVRTTAKKRNKDFDQLSSNEQLKALRQSLVKFLRRDEEELKSFQENMDKMHINKGSFVDMLEGKLEAQKKKVALKKQLLDKYKKRANVKDS